MVAQSYRVQTGLPPTQRDLPLLSRCRGPRSGRNTRTTYQQRKAHDDPTPLCAGYGGGVKGYRSIPTKMDQKQTHVQTAHRECRN
jgi:hypothetical protein